MRLRLVAALLLLPGWAHAESYRITPLQSREAELGVESFYYPTVETALNRGNVLGLDPDEALLRVSGAWKETHGGARFVVRGFVERSLGGTGDETTVTLRQGYAQYWWGTGCGLRAGKQRVAWGSGFVWNPTNRLEPAKNPVNASLEQEGVWAARLDVVPASWVGAVLVATRGDTSVGDLPFGSTPAKTDAGALRVRFLVKDTDLAVVYSGGQDRPSLLGFDLARDVGPLSLHAEGSVYRGSEIPPARNDERFFRIVTGALRIIGETSIAIEYFYNGEGYDDTQMAAYLGGLDAAYAAATDPRLPAQEQDRALRQYLAAAAVPYSGGLGLRRHYLEASWSRAHLHGDWTLTARALVGLSDGGIGLTPGIGYAPRGNVTLNLDGVLLLGPQDSEYRLAPVHGALQARVKVLF